ncbi:MAG: pyridoxamine kinase [Oscillospiraceae bacterium]|nr:pyridoxamine kinase [Oscillospiraceae bacterium]
MYSRTAKVAAIHDLSGVGRCSLSVILPTLSAQGIQVCPVPTAILSAHTGGFGEVVLRDLTDYISPALEHYKRLNYEFDCVYSGFLASTEQIDHCLEFFEYYKAALKVVDPVMADNGKPYKTCTHELCSRMGELAAIADIITPNITEAAILLRENPVQPDTAMQKIKSYLVRLSELGPKIVVITSVFSDGKAYNVGYDREHSKFWRIPYNMINARYPGTGDVFASVLTGSILRGDSLPIAMNRATAFLERAIKTTYSYSTDTREGIMLESCLDFLITNPTLCDYEQM